MLAYAAAGVLRYIGGTTSQAVSRQSPMQRAGCTAGTRVRSVNL